MSEQQKEKYHHFSVTEATRLGSVEKAIILSNMRHWLDKNLANGKNVRDGFVWTYNSSRAFGKLFPYMNHRSIGRWLKELEKDEIIKSSSKYNKAGFDKTKWFTIPDEYEVSPVSQNDQSIGQNGESISQNDQTIPDSKPDSKPDSNPPYSPPEGTMCSDSGESRHDAQFPAAEEKAACKEPWEQKENMGAKETTEGNKSPRGQKKGRRAAGFVRDNPPTKEEVAEYVRETGNREVNPYKFHEYYSDPAVNWTMGNGKKIKCWKRTLATWKSRSTRRMWEDDPSECFGVQVPKWIEARYMELMGVNLSHSQICSTLEENNEKVTAEQLEALKLKHSHQ